MEPGTSLKIETKRALLLPPLPPGLMRIVPKLEGRKNFPKTGGFVFEPTHFNLDLFRATFPDVPVEDGRKGPGGGQKQAIGVRSGPGSTGTTYVSKTTPYGDFQTRATLKGLATPFYGLFMEQGTGKSKVAIDIAGHRWCAGEITGVLIIAFNGVHGQWVEEAIPDHLGEMVPRTTYAYVGGKKGRLPDNILSTDKLAFFTINFEAVWRKDGMKAVMEFLEAHEGRVMGIVDEGQRIKNPEAKSTLEIVELAPYCAYRLDLTGTPIAKDLTDIYSQFRWLDPRILGYRYTSTFRADYCLINPKFRTVYGSKNEDKLWEKISPYIFRVTKEEELDLPPKVYDSFVFELHPEQRKLYDSLRTEFITELSSGKIVTVKNALTLILRLQQITNGFIALNKENPEDETQLELLPWNPRMDALKQVIRSRLGKKVIWCRFTKDIELGMQQYNNAVSYYGGNGKDEKIENKKAYIFNPDIEEMFSNPSAGGTGVDGLQKVTRTAIYYSNSFNSIHRWQSEDRTHRIGMGETCTYIDLIAHNTVDRKILRRLQKNKAMSDYVLDEIRQMLESSGD